MRIMTHKKRVSLFIDSELVDSARAYGLNLSKFMGNGLNVFFSSVEKGYSWKWENALCEGPDLNRRTPAGMDPESIAFNLARQPSPVSYLVVLLGYILIISAQLKALDLSVSFKYSDSEFSFCLFGRLSSECYFNTCGIFHHTLERIFNTESSRLGVHVVPIRKSAGLSRIKDKNDFNYEVMTRKPFHSTV